MWLCWLIDRGDTPIASSVQELMGGRFGEMSTLMNYTFQSFNYRERQGTRPFYDLIASIAAEEYGHIELVADAINTMLTGATPDDPGKPGDAPLKHLKDQAINPPRKQAGLPDEPEAVVANDSKAKAKSKSKPARKAKP